MAHNPLLGNRISLISKKDIRYEGTLYSINEADATVALANVKSYGTEGREVSSGGTFIPPMTDVFSYLVFRGCDIKDLHVHDNATTTAAATQQEQPEPSEASPITADAKPTITTTTTTSKDQSKSKRENAHEEQPLSTISPRNNQSLIPSNATTTTATKDSPSTTHTDSNAADAKAITSIKTTATSSRTSSTSDTTASKVTLTTAAVGTGESLLNRKVRGGTTTAVTATTTTAASNLDSKNQSSLQDEQEFDFQSSASKFEKETTEEEPNPKLHYTKDNFFDSISCDALDKQAGRTSDPRLRGAAERQLNTETFGAASLAGYSNQRRGTNNKNSSSWRRGGGAGGGRGRGRGRGNRNPNDINSKPRHYHNGNLNKKSTPKPTSSRVSPD